MIRRLSSSDAAAYRELMLEGYERHPDAFTASPEERSVLPLSWWEARLVAGPQAESLVFGAFEDLEDFAAARLLGAVGLSFATRPKERHKATVFGMYVRAEARGRGFGHSLLQATLTATRERREIRTLQLRVSEGNDDAVRLYQRCGFVAFGLEPLAIQVGARFLAKIHMSLDLAAKSPDPTSDPIS